MAASKPICFRPATEYDLDAIRSIEISATQKFRDYLGVDIPATTVPENIVLESIGQAHAWIYIDNEIPVGFIVARRLDDGVHIDEFSVAYEYQNKGIGRYMLNEFISVTQADRYPHITLTTDKSIPWNAPFYRKFGFAEIPLNDCSLHLEEILLSEKNRSPVPNNRIAMMLTLKR